MVGKTDSGRLAERKRGLEMMMAWTGVLAVEGISNGLGRGVG